MNKINFVLMVIIIVFISFIISVFIGKGIIKLYMTDHHEAIIIIDDIIDDLNEIKNLLDEQDRYLDEVIINNNKYIEKLNDLSNRINVLTDNSSDMLN